MIGLASIIIEPMFTYFTKKHEGYAKLGTLGLLTLGILALIASLPCVIHDLNLHIAYSTIPLGLLIIRYIWQFAIDRKSIKKVKVGYAIVFGTGMWLLGVFLFFFVAMSIFNATIVNC